MDYKSLIWKLGIPLVALAAFVLIQTAPWAMVESRAVADAVRRLNGQWVDRPAPEFTLERMRDGQQRKLSDYRGDVVFLNFWASFCEPCTREMPSMEKLVREYEDRGFVMIAVSQDPERADMEQFMATFLPGERSAMTVLWDPRGRVATDYGTEMIPETYIIDRDGRVIARFVGEYDWTRPEVKQLIEALLNR
jgi:peroxiredoxin